MAAAIDVVIDVLHTAGAPGFTYEPGIDPPAATVKCGNTGGADFWWASCRPCWWWSEDDDTAPIFTQAAAQLLADRHNRIHHPGGTP